MGNPNNLQQTNPQIIVKEIQDLHIRQNFKALQDYFTAQNQLVDFKFTELSFGGAQENFKFGHGLNYTPKDILFTYLAGDALVKFNVGLFDSTNLDISVTEACTIRFFYGTYWGLQGLTNAAGSDQMIFGGKTLSDLFDRVATLETEVASLQKVGKVAWMYWTMASGGISGNGTTAYTARTLNNLFDPAGIVQNPSSFNGQGQTTNQTFTLGPGTYRIDATFINRGAVAAVSVSKLRLYNVDTTAILAYGPQAATSSASGVSPDATYVGLDCVIVLTKTTNLQIQQIATNIGTGGDGNGYLGNFGDVEMYGNVTVTQLA